MTWAWPQIVVAISMCIEVGFQIAKHGQPHKYNHDAVCGLLVHGLFAYVLWAGGFWG